MNTKAIYTVHENGKEHYFFSEHAGGFSYPFAVADFLHSLKGVLNDPMSPQKGLCAAPMLEQMKGNYLFPEEIEGKEFNSHFEELEYLSKLGFNVNPVRIECNTIEEIENAIKKIGEDRENLTFGIDGAVIKVDDLKFREILGTTAKTPRWAIAYKYPPEKRETILKDIICLSLIHISEPTRH